MKQSLSCTFELMESLERQRTVYLNIFVFILGKFERNISNKLTLSVDYVNNVSGNLHLLQSEIF